MKHNKSPCIDICQFTGKNSWCIGCGRTPDECKKMEKNETICTHKTSQRSRKKNDNFKRRR